MAGFLWCRINIELKKFVVVSHHRADSIVVRDALVQAGVSPDDGWHILLKVRGLPKEAVTLTDTVDRRRPGIEKLRLTPKEVGIRRTEQWWVRSPTSIKRSHIDFNHGHRGDAVAICVVVSRLRTVAIARNI